MKRENKTEKKSIDFEKKKKKKKRNSQTTGISVEQEFLFNVSSLLLKIFHYFILFCFTKKL